MMARIDFKLFALHSIQLESHSKLRASNGEIEMKIENFNIKYNHRRMDAFRRKKKKEREKKKKLNHDSDNSGIVFFFSKKISIKCKINFNCSFGYRKYFKNINLVNISSACYK